MAAPTIPLLPDQGTPPPPVIVLGMHNSGTTLLARILHENGLFLGCNAGMYESHFFSHFINNRLILGGEEAAWAKLPVIGVDEVLNQQERIEPVIRSYWRMDYIQWGYDGCGPWGFKDPRACILLPLYLRIFPDAKLVFIRRSVDDIASSLAHRFKPGIGICSDVRFWKELTLAYVGRVEAFGAPHPNFFELRYEELCTEPKRTSESLFDYLGLPFSDSVAEYVGDVVKTASIGTATWSESRWRWEARRKRFKRIFGPLYDALRGKI